MKALLKNCLYGCAVAWMFPWWLLYRLEAALLGREKCFYGWSQALSLLPGLGGNYLRYGFYKLALQSLGRDACICFGATLAHPGITLGKGVYVGPFCNLGLCVLEDDVLLGTGSHVLSGMGQHGIEDLETPIREQPGHFRAVRVGADSWIGNKSVIGCDVGKKCVVGAGSVVVKPLPDYAVAAGNPAKVIRLRGENPA